MRGRGEVWREEGRNEQTVPKFESFERLTSGQMGSPETRDLREQGRESTACSVSARGHKEKGKEWREDAVSPSGDSQRSKLRPRVAKKHNLSALLQYRSCQESITTVV